ncbi:MAG: hypothetical protein A2804_01735 [Candidatus Pacebacteria bacterium RIFCSPHIGHO2_01_FULL_46_10]|nr:MAG: hypothetical protein A2804_01735 [Candidatus Pacebacteria bacterium RIFCSPHIGHO2_01_FULL_46_10]
MAYVFNFYTQIIDVTNPQATVVIQDLINEIRTQESSATGMAYPKIADAGGKDDLGGGVSTGITVTLYPDWQLRFWAGSYIADITGGNLVGGLGGNPFAYVAGVQIKVIQSAASTIVTSGGSALTTAEHDKLMSGLDATIPPAVWEELLASHQTAGTMGKAVKDIKTKATLGAISK